MTWDKRWMALAQHVSQWSKDRSTKVGAVIVNSRQVVVAFGWNGFPRGVDDDVSDRHLRPTKYLWTEHAERNAIYNAAAEGMALRGCRLYTSKFPCAACARAIIQTGIIEVIVLPSEKLRPKLLADEQVSVALLEEAQISIYSCYQNAAVSD